MHYFDIKWETLTAISTTVLVIVGIWQINRIRAEAKRERTLAVCNRYDSDVVLNGSLSRLIDARKSGEIKKEPSSYNFDVTCVLNYLDSVAIGINQDVYDEEIVRAHLQSILSQHVYDYLRPEVAKTLEISAEQFQNLVELNSRWARPNVPVCWLGSDA